MACLPHLPSAACCLYRQLSKHCSVTASKHYIQCSNLGHNSGNSGCLLTSFCPKFWCTGTFCGRKYGHLDVNWSTANQQNKGTKIISSSNLPNLRSAKLKDYTQFNLARLYFLKTQPRRLQMLFWKFWSWCWSSESRSWSWRLISVCIRKLVTANISCSSIHVANILARAGGTVDLWRFSSILVWSLWKIWLLFLIPCAYERSQKSWGYWARLLVTGTWLTPRKHVPLCYSLNLIALRQTVDVRQV